MENINPLKIYNAHHLKKHLKEFDLKWDVYVLASPRVKRTLPLGLFYSLTQNLGLLSLKVQ